MSLAAARTFEERMLKMVKLRYPERTRVAPDQELRAIIHSGVERAKGYGIDLTHDVERFICLMFRFRAFNFEEDPPTAWTWSILRDESLTAEAKLDEIEGRAVLFHILGEDES